MNTCGINEKNIEVEVRSFIDEVCYRELEKRLRKEAEFLGEDEQTTFYFDAKEDLRIQQGNAFSKIWLKKGKLHDESREEIEIFFKREDFPKLERLFAALGYSVLIKWFRQRKTFRWGDISVMLDHTRGYGYIIELEKMTAPEERESAARHLKEKMLELGVSPTPREEFEKRYQFYKDHWRGLTTQAP